MGPEGMMSPEIEEEAAKFEREQHKGPDMTNADTIPPGAIDAGSAVPEEGHDTIPKEETRETNETAAPMQAHRSWKEKIISSLTDYNGKRAETVHLMTMLSGASGGLLASMANPNVHQFMREGLRMENNPVSTPEQFLLAGGAFIGGAAVLEISNYIMTKIAEKKDHPVWRTEQSQSGMGAK